jgi:hypothetical protein
MVIEVDPGDLIGGEILRQGSWERETFCFLEQWLAPGMTVIDVGGEMRCAVASGREPPGGSDLRPPS